MARPKGSKNKVEDAQGVETTKVTEVKVAPVKKEEKPLKKDDLYLLIVNGEEQYWTKSLAVSALTRGSHDIEVPKGSPFVPPVNSKCKGCG